MRLFLICCFLLLLPNFLSAQKKYLLDVRENGNENQLKRIQFKTSFTSVIDREKEIQRILTTLWNQSFLAARVDSLQQDSIQLIAWISTGKTFKWAELSSGNVDPVILSTIGFREKRWKNRPLKFKEAAEIQENLLRWCEDHGYPFAQVRLDSVDFTTPETVKAKLFLQKNRFTKIDSIVVKGNLKIAPAFLYTYIGIAPGDAYNESKIKAISARLRELPYLRETKPFTILFTEKQTKITLYLEKKKAGQFDGIVGVLPDSRTGKIIFTGDVRLRLQNSFGRGELIDLNWRRLQEQTQDLKARATYPCLFRTPFGIDYNIKLYRRDTTFLDIQQIFGVQYLFSGNTSLKAYINRRNSNLLSTRGLENTTVLPQFADIATTSYGLGFRHEKLNYRLNPRRGYALQISADAGNRTIRKNAKLNPVVYENIILQSVQYHGELELEKFWPLGKRSTIKTGLQTASIINNTTIFRNELFRIGGFRSVRGFDEESIFASSFAIGTLEYRFLLEENSNFFIFADGCWYENNSQNTFITDTPYGFGTGVSFETKAGILSLQYALGSQFGNPILLRDGKIHLGLVNIF